MSPIRKELGLSVAEAAYPLNVFRLIQCVGLVPVGLFIDINGARAPLVVAFLVASLLAFGLPMAHSNYQILLLMIVYSFTVLFGGLPSFLKLASSWFDDSFGLASSIIISGFSLAGFITPLLLGVISAQYGWRMALTVVDCSLLFAGLPLALMFVKENKRPELVHSFAIPESTRRKQYVNHWGDHESGSESGSDQSSIEAGHHSMDMSSYIGPEQPMHNGTDTGMDMRGGDKGKTARYDFEARDGRQPGSMVRRTSADQISMQRSQGHRESGTSATTRGKKLSISEDAYVTPGSTTHSGTGDRGAHNGDARVMRVSMDSARDREGDDPRSIMRMLSAGVMSIPDASVDSFRDTLSTENAEADYGHKPNASLWLKLKGLMQLPFLYLMMGIAFMSLGVHVVFDHITVYASEDLGLGLSTATHYIATVNLFALFAKLGSGFLSKFIDKHVLLIIFSTGLTLGFVAMFEFIPGTTVDPWHLDLTSGTFRMFVCAALFGGGYAGMFAVSTAILPTMGKETLGLRSSIQMGSIFLFGAIGSSVAASLRHSSKSYRSSFMFGLVTSAMCVGICAVNYFDNQARSRRRPWRRDIYRAVPMRDEAGKTAVA
ncbi:hypothetical protein SARC_12628 [Sphaeroforma arctica JP610]|uniref:Major facilitator superfamily (MFS) profile domain-containing protein n=1 Tax=Sphaeroforma arctica JP610 TaxID=667725 RepID=A0A0L0FFK7_9EUKA|nr:hypothetical protein SARC_12628 [Sphaeroforma arctica JP610]KNC74833.1 hypothetical protein SARC_12628 [Sphaeroforma arctica JP610]|eukprot:XP_014148735.1 hypothetical protein SARC_12628 [Sphaeroforma arctica JP610]